MECKFNINCKLKDSDYCSESCERYIKLDYLFKNSLIPNESISPTSLFIDSDGSDREVFSYLKNVQSNIKDAVNDVENMAEIICKLCAKYEEFIALKKHSRLGKIVVLEDSSYEIPEKVCLDN